MPERHDEEQLEGRLGPVPHDVGLGSDNDRTALVATRTAPRQRLRQAAVVAGAVGIALVGVGGVLFGPWGDGSPAAPTPDPTSKADLVAALKSMLPKGRITEPEEMGAALSPSAVEVVYDDGEGPAAIVLGFSRFEPIPPGLLTPRPS
ncbi:hypothetical protein [Streptomyces sp. AS02]|uniref:hypothetical protein n=1 Tax=Streptomyces sp. AS02 TaxID=2938946 RepID=UPI00202226B2|nr:hypothetical protein [Streptomyces sp. AS02]MCL8016177.1 hypothetical protein [Streptomyces sp. AS02]